MQLDEKYALQLRANEAYSHTLQQAPIGSPSRRRVSQNSFRLLLKVFVLTL